MHKGSAAGGTNPSPETRPAQSSVRRKILEGTGKLGRLTDLTQRPESHNSHTSVVTQTVRHREPKADHGAGSGCEDRAAAAALLAPFRTLPGTDGDTLPNLPNAHGDRVRSPNGWLSIEGGLSLLEDLAFVWRSEAL